MHPMKLLGTVCCLALALCRVEANRPAIANPSVIEFGTADAALVQCFDKTIYEFNRSPSAVSFISVVQFGTYDVTLEECFYQKILVSMASPQTVAFNNPAAKAIAFISVETDQGIDFGGIEASITTGTIGTSTSITLRVATTPVSLQFLNNVHVRMFCKP
uniref:Uncharacterized protein n=1 Tax=Anopheles atroparvus TaxID=41427 RepID=A0A182IKL1_ANOAO